MRGPYNGWLDFDTAIQTRTKGQGPAADASFEVRRAGEREFTFRGARTERRVWRFGDGSGPARGRKVTHAYELPGRYRVTSVARGGRRDVFVRELRAR
jgi:PKD repeat protein